VNLTNIDWAIMLVYFIFVLGIGFLLKRKVKTSTDFFLAGRAIPAWVCGLAFISANLEAQEVIGMAASGAKYGIATSHFYWVGAIPAMVFVGIFMMPFYYGSRARSVPEYLRLRFDEKTRGLNAISFAIMTVFASGISMYAIARLIQILHVLDGPFQRLGIPPHWIFHFSIAFSALIVLGYIFFGELTSAIYNEVLQFFLIVAGFLPLVWLGLKKVGGWHGLVQKLPESYSHSWVGMGSPHTNPLGVEWFGLVMGLGFVLSFGYWCTDFLVVQRAMAADSMTAARRTPLIAAIPKMLFPFLVILPGLIAVALPANPVSVGSASMSVPATASPEHALSGKGLIPAKINQTTGQPLLDQNGKAILDYDLAIPNMLLHYFPTGILGLGLTALLASFMSGMAGNVTAFNTVWTYDIYQSYIRPNASDAHYLWMGKVATVFWYRPLCGRRLCRYSLQQHYGHAPVGVRFRERTAVCDVFAGHVLETCHRPRSVPWTDFGYHCSRNSSRSHLASRHGAGDQGCLARPCYPLLSERDGAKLLDRHLGVDDLFCRDDCH